MTPWLNFASLADAFATQIVAIHTCTYMDVAIDKRYNHIYIHGNNNKCTNNAATVIITCTCDQHSTVRPIETDARANEKRAWQQQQTALPNTHGLCSDQPAARHTSLHACMSGVSSQ